MVFVALIQPIVVRINMLGVIGGSGLYSLEKMRVLEELEVETPYGSPSGKIVIGDYEGRKIAFLPRHGKSHQFLPSEINFRANIFALKKVGVTSIASVSAVGSLREDIAPGEMSLVGQYIDFTKKRDSSFFGNGIAAHVSTAKPSCDILGGQIAKAAELAGFQIHRDKTYVCVEGPRLGTQAESHMFRSWGADLVGMTNAPEAFLAKEAQISYCTLTISTDYDCWREDESEFVSVEQVIKKFGESIAKVKLVLEQLFKLDWDESQSDFRTVLNSSVLTPDSAMSSEQLDFMKTLRL